MGAEVTRRRPADADPARDRGARLRGRATTLDDLGEADVVYALRMQHERMSEAFVPSLREYAADYQIDGRRLRRRASCSCTRARSTAASSSPARSIDSPQSLITEQVAAGVVVRMASSTSCSPAERRAGEPVAGAASPHERAACPHDAARPRARRSAADLLVRGAPRPRPARRASTASHDVLVRGGRIAEIAAPGARRGAGRRRGRRRRGPARCSRPSSTRTSTCARPGQEHKEDIETGTRAAAAGGFCAVVAMPNTDPVVDSPPILGALRETARARRARSRSASWPSITRGLAGEELTEMAELRDAGRARLHRRRPAGRQRRDAAPGAPVPAPRAAACIALHEEDPTLSRRRRDARGRGLARARRSPASRRVASRR